MFKRRDAEAWYSVAPNFLEELNNLMPRTIADLIKQIEKQGIHTDFNLWCRRTCMKLCFQWKIFK